MRILSLLKPRALKKGIRYLRLLGLRLLIHAVMEKLRGRTLFFYNEEQIIQDSEKNDSHGKVSIHNIEPISQDDNKVSIIIPSDSFENITLCVENLTKNTTYTNYEIVAVTNSQVANKLEKIKITNCELRIALYDKPFNFSDKCNEGAAVASGNVLCFYNDDISPIDKDWIEGMLQALSLPNVGAVTPIQMLDSTTVLSAGFVLGTPGLQTFAFHGARYTPPRHLKSNQFIVRDVSALSGACFLIKKDVFDIIVGFNDKDTPNSFSDTEISLKIRDNGHRLVITPNIRMYHENKITWRKTDKPDKAFQYMMQKWGKYFAKDIFFDDRLKTQYKIAPPPHIYKYHSPKKAVHRNPNGRDILIISHELSLSGAPIVLIDLVKVVLENGDLPVVVSLLDGPLRMSLLAMGITVIIDNSICDMTENSAFAFDYVARNFDIAIINTLASWRAVEILKDSLPPVLWWIHESPFGYNCFKHSLPHELPPNVRAYVVSNYSASALKSEGLTYNLGKLTYGVRDRASIPAQNSPEGIITFLIIGSIEHRKGHDVLLKALENIESNIMQHARFILIGSPPVNSTLDGNVYELCLSAKDKYDNFDIMNKMPREELQKWYNLCDLLIIPSREDPLPVVANEAMMFSKPVICSDRTGTADYITQKVNGIVFPSEDFKALAEYITFAINNRDKMAEMGQRARKEVFEKHFTLYTFRINALQAIEATIESR